MARTRVIDRVGVLRRNYQEFYLDSLENLYVRHDGENPDIIDEMEKFYQYLVNESFMKEIPNLHYVTQYITHDMVDMENEPSLAVQLSNHIIEMNTMKEADLCNSKSIDDRIFVSTVHKAKGLEFDNVIIFDAIEGRYPNYASVIPTDNPNIVTIDRKAFISALRRVMPFASESTQLIKLRLEMNNLELNSEDLDFATSAREDVACEYGGVPMSIGFKGSALAEILNNLSSDEVIIELADPSRAGVIRPAEQPENEDVLMLIMPMLLND